MGPKFPYLSIFGLEFWKATVIFEINDLKFVKTEFLTQIVNFYIWSTLSKDPGSAFSEDSDPDQGQIYKVCQINYRNLQETLKTGNRIQLKQTI